MIFDLVAVVDAFIAVKTFQKPTFKGNISAFAIFLQRISQERHLTAGVKYAQQIKLLVEEFNNRLTISIKEKLYLKIIKNPFLIDPKEAPSHLQTEVIDFLASSVYKSRGEESSLQDFYKYLQKRVKKFTYFGKTNAQLIWEYLHL